MITSFNFSGLKMYDKPITYYVAGYIARRLIKMTNCENCHNLFSDKKEPISVEVDTTDASAEQLKAGNEFVDEISRGGLIKPSQLLNVVAAHANELWRYIKNNNDVLTTLISSANSRAVFTKTFISKLKERSTTKSIVEAKCKSDHSFSDYVPIVSNVMFNIFAKNFAAEANSAIHKERKRNKTKDKKDNDKGNSSNIDDDEKPSKKLKRDPCSMKQKKLSSQK